MIQQIAIGETVHVPLQNGVVFNSYDFLPYRFLAVHVPLQNGVVFNIEEEIKMLNAKFTSPYKSG